MESKKLQLIVLYTANANEYSLASHNQAPEQTERFIQELKPHLIPGSSLLTFDQKKAHKTVDAESCVACREIVRRTSGLEPLPKFRRRKK